MTEMGLGTILDRLAPERVIGLPVGEVRGLAYDSRKVQSGSLFFAIPGIRTDGHHYLAEAVAAGALAVVVERPLADLPVAQAVVADARAALADAADLWFGEPSRHLVTVGVTGTNGKSTVTAMCVALLAAAGLHPGQLGTVSLTVGDTTGDTPTRFTTPEAPELQELLARMLAAGNQAAVIEASSHGLAMRRVRNCRFRAGIVTNLSPEHLEFHGSWQAYRAAKGLLVEEAPLAILNRDDPSYAWFRERARDRVVSFGWHVDADLRATGVDGRIDGSSVSITSANWNGTLEVPMIGRVNVENALAAFAFAIGWGIDPEMARGALATAHGPRGRMQQMAQGQPFRVVVDYAHTPDALAKALGSLRALVRGRLLVVTGCAAWGDLAKRPEIGRVAAEVADFVFIADEDPRAEDPDQINRQVAEGARRAGKIDGVNLFVINDRRAAIAAAIAMARTGDAVLLAGKGHEHSMLVAAGAIPWDDGEVARESLLKAGYAGSAP